MIVATPRMFARHMLAPAMNTARPDGYYWDDDRAVAYLAAMESNLVHARLLDDFFIYATADVPITGRKANDRYAAQYCVSKGWNGYRVLTEDEHVVIDRQLSHFTTLRRPFHNIAASSQHSRRRKVCAASYRRTCRANATGRYGVDGSFARDSH